MIFARFGDVKQTRLQNMAEIVFSWGVSEIKYIIFIENSDYLYENYNNYIKFRLFVHGESAIYCHVYNVTLDTCEMCVNVFRHSFSSHDNFF